MFRKLKTINFILILSLVTIFVVVINVFCVSLGKVHLRSNTSLEPYVQSVALVSENIFANRGYIFDTNGQVVAQDKKTYDIICFLDKNRISNKNQIAYVDDPLYTSQVLSNILKMGQEEIYYYLTQEGLYQTELGIKGRNLSEETKDEILNYPNLHGIAFKESTKRIYPLNADFSPYLIGFAQSDDSGKLIGKMGIEAYLNEELSGIDGKHIYQSDKSGYILPGMYEETIPEKNGYNVYLTIDTSIQEALESSFKQVENENGASKAWGAVVEIDTGKILAWGQTPSFDPNVLEIEDYLNYGSQFAYEPGSVMKSFIYATAMDIGTYDGHATFDSDPFCYLGNDPYRVYSSNNYGCIYNAGKKSWGTIELDYGLILSSNVATSTLLADYVTPKVYEEYLDRFGFFKAVDTDGIEEVTGYKNYRYPSEKLALTYGQGSSVTMLQLLQAYTAIFGNGEMIKPYFIDRIVDSYDEEIVYYRGNRQVVSTPIKESTAKQMQDLLERVVSDPKGTAQYYAIDEVSIMAKTGTSEIAEGAGYNSGDSITSVMLAFPVEDPQYMIYYAYISPYDYYNHTFSDPIQNFIKKTAILTNVGYNRNSEQILNEIKTYEMKDYLNKPLVTVKEELEDMHMNVVVIGDGTQIIDQYPKDQANIYSGQKVFLKTEGNIKLEDLSLYSRKEVLEYASLIDLDVHFSGSGLVDFQSIEKDTIIDTDMILEIHLKDIQQELVEDEAYIE